MAISRDIFEGAKTLLDLPPSKYPLKWPIKKFIRNKIISRIFKISGTLKVKI